MFERTKVPRGYGRVQIRRLMIDIYHVTRISLTLTRLYAYVVLYVLYVVIRAIKRGLRQWTILRVVTVVKSVITALYRAADGTFVPLSALSPLNISVPS